MEINGLHQGTVWFYHLIFCFSLVIVKKYVCIKTTTSKILSCSVQRSEGMHTYNFSVKISYTGKCTYFPVKMSYTGKCTYRSQ